MIAKDATTKLLMLKGAKHQLKAKISKTAAKNKKEQNTR